jgi:peptidoglycan pentaglycine glycine transferase (the first glycine)
VNQKDWNKFVLKHGPRSGRFLQSWEWGEFQQSVGEKIERRRVEEGGSQSLWVRKQVPMFGEYWYAPRGPIGKMDDVGGGAMFARIEPEKLEMKARKSIDLQPAVTSILDLSKSEEDLLAGMHHKTRYNIRLAERKGVEIDLEETDFDAVWKLFGETGVRGGFKLHSKKYYEKQLAALAHGECRAFLGVAKFEGEAIAATIMIDFGDTRTYVHGASERTHRKLMAPALLHWRLIQDAKQRGFKWYDWWGVAPADAENHPWEGISRFKRGYGGEDVEYPGTHDVILKPLRYRLYTLARKIRRFV